MSAESTRLKLRNKYREIIGRNYYNDSSKRKHVYTKASDGKYWSDCSSSVSGTYREIGLDIPWMRTTDMWDTDLFIDVPVEIKNGIIQNPGILRIGDMLLFAGTHSSRKAWGYVGHVEMVGEIGNTITLYGHGSGHPKKHEMNSYCRTRYRTKTSKTPIGNCGLIRVRRFVCDETDNSTLLRKGDKGEAVKLMQGLLLAQGYKLPKYGADGDFGSETFAALRQYQADHGLPITGIYDAETEKSLTEGAQPARFVESTGNGVNVRTAPSTVTGKKLGKVYKGDRLPYQGIISDEGWYLVVYNGQNAWISGKYAQVAA